MGEPVRPQSWSRGRWSGPRLHAQEWSAIGASAFLIRCLTYGVWDPPDRPFCKGRVLPAVPQTTIDLEFARKELSEGCVTGTYQEVTKAYAMAQVSKGSYVSSAFVDWSRGKGRFIINLKLQSTHWDKKSVAMESLSSFGACLKRGDHMISFDWKGGYRHFALHSKMWNWFLFHYDGRFYRCIALPFGWTRSPYWFCHILSPLTRYIRSALNCRVLTWIDDYLLVPGVGTVPSTSEDCEVLCTVLDPLFARLGMLRHPQKGVWGLGVTKIEHLGVIIDTENFRYFVTPEKLENLQNIASHLLQTSAKARRWVRESTLRTFAGKAVSQLVPLPLARFFTRGIYDDLKHTNARRGQYPEQKIRLSNAGRRDLQAWRTMLAGDGRLICGGEESWNLHTDAADVGFGGTLGRDMRPGSPGVVEVQSIWSPFLRLKSITHRELVAVRRSLENAFIRAQLHGYHGSLLLHVDNMAVFYIVNNMVSSNPALMSELRRLHSLLVEMKITIRASWIPSALNKHADRLSRTWKPFDLAATPSLMQSLAESLQLQTVRREWPLKDAPAARVKVLESQFAEYWGDGLSRLWNPPPSLIAMTLLKIEAEQAHGVIVVPHWTGATWYKLLQRVSLASRVINPGSAAVFESASANPAWALELAEVGHRRNARSGQPSPLMSLTLPGAVPAFDCLQLL